MAIEHKILLAIKFFIMNLLSQCINGFHLNSHWKIVLYVNTSQGKT